MAPGRESPGNATQTAITLLRAIYGLQAPFASTQVQIGAWNNYIIEANGPSIRVTLNGLLVNDYQSPRQQTGHVALQAHDFLSRTQFRNLQIRKLP